jgi:hypothetical protein
VTSELAVFVRESLARGISREQILEALLKAGWETDEIESALAEWAEVEFPVPIPRRKPYLSAREAFLYLVMFATLYVVAFNVGAVGFALIDWRWPDPARQYGNRFTEFATRARFATASLLTAFPVFLFVARLIARSIARDPEKRRSKIRKWLTYLTLFLAALVLIGDLIALVSAVLSGELGTRFLLKVALVFAIAAVVFGHYLGDLRREEAAAGPATAPRRSPLAWVGGAATIVAIVMGLWFIGSPHEERQRQLDRIRVEDLRAISGAIESMARERGVLPATLDQLANSPNTYVRSTRDPVRGVEYEYVPGDSLRYELCATFDHADSLDDAGLRFWRHGPGRRCYEFRVWKTVPGTVAAPVR